MSGDVLPAIVGIVLVAAAAVFALLPFLRAGGSLEGAASASGSDDRFALYRQILELEFDLQLGKLSTADFELLSSQLLAQAGQALRQEHGNLAEIDAEIEREIAAARAAFVAARRSTQPRVETVS